MVTETEVAEGGTEVAEAEAAVETVETAVETVETAAALAEEGGKMLDTGYLGHSLSLYYTYSSSDRYTRTSRRGWDGHSRRETRCTFPTSRHSPLGRCCRRYISRAYRYVPELGRVCPSPIH